jgi:hypothetical protein
MKEGNQSEAMPRTDTNLAHENFYRVPKLFIWALVALASLAMIWYVNDWATHLN